MQNVLIQQAPAAGGGSVLTTEGDILYRDSTGLARLAKGTAGQKLRQNAALTAPEWESGWETINAASFSGVASVDWTDLGDFVMLWLRGVVLPATDGVSIFARTDADNGASFDAGAADYTYNMLYTLAGSGLASVTSGTAYGFYLNINTVGSAAGEGLEFDLRIGRFNKAEVCKMSNQSNGVGTGGIYTTGMNVGERSDTTARNALRIISSSGNISGNYILQGVRG